MATDVYIENGEGGNLRHTRQIQRRTLEKYRSGNRENQDELEKGLDPRRASVPSANRNSLSFLPVIEKVRPPARKFPDSRAFRRFLALIPGETVFRLLILLAALPVAAAFVARWWFGMRILSTAGRRQCTCDLGKWEKAFGPENPPPSKSGDARIYAELLRKAALKDWATRDPKAAASREGTRRFGMAVPPLSLLIAVLAIIVGKIPVTGAIAIFLLAIAFAVVLSYLSIAPELKAILTTSRRLRDSGVFFRRDDEDAVIEAAAALAWKEGAPPVFNLIQK